MCLQELENAKLSQKFNPLATSVSFSQAFRQNVNIPVAETKFALTRGTRNVETSDTILKSKTNLIIVIFFVSDQAHAWRGPGWMDSSMGG